MSTKKEVTEYQVNVSRDGKFWLIGIPALDGATQARNLTEVEEMARDYITELTGTSSFDVDVHIELPSEVREHLAAARALREEESVLRQRAAEEARAAARVLKSDGLTVREIGRALGVSHQRAQQLITT